ncbi:hypothetical protein D1007_27279 [Hordeum vulgare]|nr:hypothetical protein D1007_27279 [Hordeum vulgare]
MDGCADIPLIRFYVRDPSVVVAAVGANPNSGSFGFASTGSPPTTGLARGLFMTPWTTSADGVAPALAVKSCVPLLKLPNAAVMKAGKVSGKKHKAANNSSRRPLKKLVATNVAVTESPTGSLVAPATDAHMNMLSK